MWVEYQRTSTQSNLLFNAGRWTAIDPHPCVYSEPVNTRWWLRGCPFILYSTNEKTGDLVPTKAKKTEKCISIVPPEAEKSGKMHFNWYLFLKNHYSNALPERGAASSNPGIHQISPQKWWTQVWVHHFWDLDVYTQRKSKNMKNDGPNSGYIIFGVFFRYITNIPRV